MIFAPIDNMRYLLLLCFLYSTVSAQNLGTKKVLWIGNSYTYVNDLPTMFRLLALSGGDSIIVDSSTPGGYSFAAHSTYTTTLQKLAANNNDFVVLQAQSQEPSFPPFQVESETFPYAHILDSLAKAGSPCSQTVFYMTWGRKYGDSQNCASYPPLCTFEGMNDRLRWAYKQMADDNEALVSPAGTAWRKSWEADSTINLWSVDNSHPSVAGSYLTACVFYGTILRKSPVGLTYTAGLSTEQSGFLQNIAFQTVFDSLDTWNISRWDVKSDFTFLLDGLSIQTSNQSHNADSYTWDFGDGETSTEISPNHNYTVGDGSFFTIKLIATDSCNSDTSSFQIEINTEGIQAKKDEFTWRVYPNPANSFVMIQASHKKMFDIRIYSADGSLTKHYKESGELIPIPLEGLAPGMYQVVCQSGKEQQIFRLIKN